MAGSLHKARKQISKKRNGDINALHQKSRDSQRLHRAAVRDQRLLRLASARSKLEQPIVDRAAFFQRSLADTPSLDLTALQSLIHSFVHQHDDEYAALKKSRRSGRPPSAREDLLKMKTSALETEYGNGFLLPDVMDEANADKLRNWEGSWTPLKALAWIKVTRAGHCRPAEFPSKGIS